MASIVFVVNGLEWDKHQQSKHGKAKGNMLMDSTIKKYKDYTVKFLSCCNDNYGTSKPKKCKKYIQVYADYLKAQGKSASTIHDYTVGVCRVLNVPIKTIHTARRVTAENKNNRRVGKKKAVDRRTSSKAKFSLRLYRFAMVVGIRRAEYGNLHGKDFEQDESGYWCVLVRKGKNGKRHHQRIPEKEVEFVKSYFNDSEDYVFSKAELANLINLHRLRGALARQMYKEYLHRIETEPGYADQLREELKARFKECGVDESKWDDHEVQGVYRVRGANRKRAKELGLPIEYDRLAVMAVSVFHLSHWRTNVTVTNYLLAI